jgi:chromosome segregation ATPase
LTDSNRLLREEKQKIEALVNGYKAEAEQARTSVGTLELKIKELEDVIENLSVEKTALATESENWKKRSDQLIEKSFKLNPDELRRLQEQNQKLTNLANAFKKEKIVLNEKIANLGKELSEVKQAAAAGEQEAKKVQAELQEKLKENRNLLATQATYKTAHQNMNKQNLDLKKKLEELEKAKTEALSAFNKVK